MMFDTTNSQSIFPLSNSAPLDTSIHALTTSAIGLTDPLQTQSRPASSSSLSIEQASSGVFTVGATGQVSFDYLFDGGAYEGEVAIFDLTGMDRYFQAGSEFFAREVALRALTNTDLGHIVISDQTEGARFSGSLPYEGDFNAGTYSGAKTFTMRPGEHFGIMLVPNGKVEDVLFNCKWEDNQLPIFSISLANSIQATQFTKLLDSSANTLSSVDGNTFNFEDLRLDGHSDYDYNDMIFQVRGATGDAMLIDKVIDPQYDWRKSDLGKAIIDYAKPYLSPNNPKLGETLPVDIQNILKQAQNSQIELGVSDHNNASTYLDVDTNSWLKTVNQLLSSTSIQGGNLLNGLVNQNNLGAEQAKDIINHLTAEINSDIRAANSLLITALRLHFDPAVAETNGKLSDAKSYLTSAVEEVNNILKGFSEKYDKKLLENSTALLQYSALTTITKSFFSSEIASYNQLVQDASQVFDDFRATYNNIESGTVKTFDDIKAQYYALYSRVDQLLSSGGGEVSAINHSWTDWVQDTEAKLETWQKILTNGSLQSTIHQPNQSHPTALPLIGIIDTGFSANDPDIDYSRILLGKDWVGNDANPLLKSGEGNSHGTQILDIIGATRGNGIGGDGINDHSPLWLGRAIGSNNWAQSLIEFVDQVKAGKYPNALVNLSFDLTQTDIDGRVTFRTELTSLERAALTYAQQNHMLIVAAAGNGGKEMSALGQASVEFDNIITVGAANGWNPANYSNYGMGLDIVAEGDADAARGTSIAAAKVSGAASLVWAANPQLNYRQVIDTLKRTATDLDIPNWDYKTGIGLLNIPAAVNLAKATTPEAYVSYNSELLQYILDQLDVPKEQQPDIQDLFYYFDLQQKLTATAWNNPNGAIASEQASDTQDLLIGAGTGAAVGGAFAGPIGAAAGGVIGGVIGWVSGLFGSGSDEEKRKAEENLRQTEANAERDIATAAQTVKDTVDAAFQKVQDARNKLDEAKRNGASPEALKVLQDNLNQVIQQAAAEVAQAEANLAQVQMTAKQAIADATAKLDAAKKAFEEHQSVLNPFKKLADKALGVLERGVDWIKELPARIERLGDTLFKGIAALNPFSGDFWEGVVHPLDTLKNFGLWLGDVAIKAGEAAGVNEIAETLADLIKPGTRALSDREKAVARSVFGDSINLNLVRIDESALSVPVARELNNGDKYRPFTTLHTINTWGPISDETLIHELTHVWQYEHEGAVYMPNALHAQFFTQEKYDYGKVTGLKNQLKDSDGDAEKAFGKFNPEQQAEIIQNYYHKREDVDLTNDSELSTYIQFVKLVSSRAFNELNQVNQISFTTLEGSIE